MPHTTAIMQIQIFGPLGFNETMTAEGPTNVTRSNPYDPGDGHLKIDTEIVSMNLVGTSSHIGPITIVESPSKTSDGTIRQQSAGIDFPADSFFDVYVEIKTALPHPLNALHNNDPVNMYSAIYSIPPLGSTYESPEMPILLFDEGGNVVGVILRCYHIVEAGEPWYYKPSHADYALAGMPDFDERQSGTYDWKYLGAWSHCGPVAVANSLWWLDSEFEPNPVLPPAINDGFPLVSAFGAWDDHSPQNVPPLVEKLAWFMDTDGILTHLVHKGTSAADMQAGLTHYLSWSGVNPQGDVDGDGNVTIADAILVQLAFGSTPGTAKWNMAADLNQDNSVNMVDAGIVAAHMGQTGLFYEHTVNQPEFDYIEQEVERCQDVILSIGYWIWTNSTWYREDGHFVTVAGVDSNDSKIAISDPIRDAFENHLIAEGRIPIPHLHGPEPPYTTHNDAAYVSQDIYSVAPVPPVPPGLPGKWVLVGFPPETPGLVAVIEDAVITSPYGEHDLAVTEVKTDKHGCIPMSTICKTYNAHINVTVENQGTFIESFFDVYLSANRTLIGTQKIPSLAPGENTTLSFVWDTTDFAIDNYTITAAMLPVLGETDTDDNFLTDDEYLKVVIIGDINGDDWVEMMDFYYASTAYNSKPGDPNWDPNADIYSWPDGDQLVEMMDSWVLCQHFMDHYP
jgi:hypothetical protein